MKNKKYMKWAGALTAVMFLATMISVCGEEGYYFLNEQQYFINDRYIVVEIISDADPDEYGAELLCSGRRSFYTLTGMYTFEDWRFHAYGVTILLWTIFDGQFHHCDFEEYIDIYWLNGTCSRGFTAMGQTDWWNGQPPFIIGWGYDVYLKAPYREFLDYLHVHVELLEEGFPMKYYDRYFYGNWKNNYEFIDKDVMASYNSGNILNLMEDEQLQEALGGIVFN